MTDDVKNEIIKAHIYGYSVTDIMEAMGIQREAVEEALAGKEAIAQKTTYMRESGWIE